LPNRATAFVSLPIAALAVASFGIVAASLLLGARETDSTAQNRQRHTIEQALDQHGASLSRELRVQTIWSDAHDRTRAIDTEWMRNNYGVYLSDLFGYDRIFVVDRNNAPVFSFIPGQRAKPSDYEPLGGEISDLIAAVRAPESAPPEYKVAASAIQLGSAQTVTHYSIADVRSVAGHPSAVVVSTIQPDSGFQGEIAGMPMLLVAVEYLDRNFTHELGNTFGFNDLQWVQKPSENDVSDTVRALNGAPVGILAWQRDRPGLEFVQRVAPGLCLALMLFIAFSYALVKWGERQASRLVDSEAAARKAARTDPLSQLPNRVGLREAFPVALEASKNSGAPLAVFAADINRFKDINDDFGPAVGDAVLLGISKRLRESLPENAVISRPDGDEFVAIVPDVDETAAAELAADLATRLAEPFEFDGGKRVVTDTAIGYALAPRDGEAGDELLRRAELATEKAKATDERIVAFAPEMDLELSYRRSLESALRAAVAKQEIEVLYQPLMDSAGRRVVGVEALARWTDPILGHVSPDIFIPLAEETGLIQEIGDYVLRRATRDGLSWPGVNVAVNVSASQIHHGDVVEVVRDVLQENRFPPQRLEIEITESVLLTDEKRANEQIRGLQSLGVRVALDDFGTGYSSLQYLRHFGFDKLKIDRSFIDGAGAPLDSSIVLASIIKLGHDLKLVITAEGVETPEQQAWLQASGCHQLQGYLFSRPLTSAQVSAFIASYAADVATVG
jgi:diguanylate cyclase (GGDEF)-like protein